MGKPRLCYKVRILIYLFERLQTLIKNGRTQIRLAFIAMNVGKAKVHGWYRFGGQVEMDVPIQNIRDVTVLMLPERQENSECV